MLQSCCYLSLVLICRALASILAPVSPMALPLMSRETRLVLLPRALSRTLVPSLRRDSATDSDWRGWKRDKEGERWPGHVKVHVPFRHSLHPCPAASGLVLVLERTSDPEPQEAGGQ